MFNVDDLLLEAREMRGADGDGDGLADAGRVGGDDGRGVREQLAVEIAQVGDGGEEGFLGRGQDRGWG